MGATFEPANDDETEFLAAVMEQFEPELKAASVTVSLLFARGEVTEAGDYKPPLMKKGIRAIAQVKINSYSDRVEGKSDATIKYDRSEWDMHPDETRRAILHHELHHLMLVRNDYGTKKDDHDRPVLKYRNHDFEVGWFRDVAAVHGEASGEARQARALLDDSGQMMWPWAPNGERSRERRAPEPKSRSNPLTKGTVTISSRGKSVTVLAGEFNEHNPVLLDGLAGMMSQSASAG